MRLGRILVWAGAAVAATLLAVAGFDLRLARPSEVRVETSFSGNGPIRAGAAKVELVPALPGVVAGYPPPRTEARAAAAPLWARALVLESGGRSVALVSVELLEVPTGLAERIRRRALELGLDDAMVGATHTHSSLGGYDDNLAAQIAATGVFRRKQAKQVEEAMVAAIERARADLRPAVARASQTELSGVSMNRDDWKSGPIDPRLTTLAVRGVDGHAIASLIVFGAHPTLVPKTQGELDGDFPGRAMTALERDGGVALFFQGVFGDVTARPPKGEGLAMDRMGEAVALAAKRAMGQAALAVESAAEEKGMAWASARFALPRAESGERLPAVLSRAAANVLHALLPAEARVAALRMGGQLFLFVPAEPTVRAADGMRARLGDGNAAVVGVAGGYVGYLEAAERVRQGVGEAKRTLYGPELAERIGAALEACVAAAQ